MGRVGGSMNECKRCGLLTSRTFCSALCRTRHSNEQVRGASKTPKANNAPTNHMVAGDPAREKRIRYYTYRAGMELPLFD